MGVQDYTIVLIADDKQITDLITENLINEYKTIKVFDNQDDALDKMHIIRPDIILLDMFIGHQNGLDTLEIIRKQGYSTPIIMMTATSDLKMAIHGMKLGAADFIVKPLNIEQVKTIIKRAISHYEMSKRVEIMSEQLKATQPDEILGESEELVKALKIANTIAKANTTVLLYGESGTGKELFAKLIHNSSDRAKGPFITINCGAIPKEIAENELFGYERGAFTGAIDKIKHGKFEQAHHGTILLDEISELSLDLQVKLLRVLQEKKYYRLGGAKEIVIDVRVIASSNKELEPMVEEGKFREDLYYRLNVAKIVLPPLRKRKNDIMLLATAFVAEFNNQFNKNISGFSPQALQTLESYPWRGNIRELKNAIERVVLLEEKDIISEDSLGFLKTSRLSSRGELMAKELENGKHILHVSKIGASYNEVIKDLIIQTMKISESNIKKAAKILGLTTLKLQDRIQQLDISEDDWN
jgi:DNA-binding NtrC family response regulator